MDFEFDGFEFDPRDLVLPESNAAVVCVLVTVLATSTCIVYRDTYRACLSIASQPSLMRSFSPGEYGKESK